MTFSLGSAPRSLVKYNDQSLSAITEVASGAGLTDDMVLIKELTASSSDDLSFVDGTDDVVLDSTYPIYVFKFIGIHPSTDDAHFSFQGNAAGGSGYNETITSTAFRAYHNEGDTDTALSYSTTSDTSGSTGFQILMPYLDNDNDSNGGGSLYLFNPSSTTFVKHWIANTQSVFNSAYTFNLMTAGYLNTASAVDEIQFKCSSGTIDAGTIKLYGLKDS